MVRSKRPSLRQFSLKALLILPCVVYLVMVYAKSASKGRYDGWERGFVFTDVTDAPFVFNGALGSENDREAKFGYLVIDTRDQLKSLPSGLRKNGDWGKSFAGEDIPWIDGVFYLGVYIDGQLKFFGQVKDEWVQHKFSQEGEMSKRDIKDIASKVDVDLGFDIMK